MKESVIYQAILREGMAEGKAEGLAEGEAKGEAKGLAEGKAETTKQIALNMLRSNIALDLVVQITGLSLKQVQKLQKPNTKKSDTKLPKTSKSSKKSRSPNSV